MTKDEHPRRISALAALRAARAGWGAARLALLVAAASSLLDACGHEDTAGPPAVRDAGKPDKVTAPIDVGSDEPDVRWVPPGTLCSVGDFTICSADQICKGSCSGPGTCQSIEILCQASPILGAVCGCDGRTYATTCDAYKAGVMVGPASACAAPEGRFPCGDEFCDPSQHHCCKLRWELGYGYCERLYPACRGQSVPDCGCFTGDPNKCRIAPGPTPGLEIMCPPT